MATDNSTPARKARHKAEAPLQFNCSECGSAVQMYASVARRTPLRRCPSCRKTKPLDQRFWALVSKSEGCWEWQGGKTTAGYGQISEYKKTYYAHRLAYEWYVGPVPQGMFVCHRCDNPSCVRPDHLFVGTAAENVVDAMQKRRYRPWGRTPTRVVLPDEIREIRRRVIAGETQRAVASDFGISFRHASYICTGQCGRGVS
jgi:hypothetical protein